MSYWSQMYLQNSYSSIMKNMLFFHDYLMMYIMMIMIMIMYMYMYLIYNKFNNLNLLDNQMIEFIWTLIPMLLLLFIAIPSLKILYLTDEIILPSMTLKILAYQWYWSFEYNDYNLLFDSFMINKNNFRLLSVDNNLIIPMKLMIRLLISSMDVIHSFTIPSLGIKIDGFPGRLNQIMMYINRSGNFYGQCSEICGINHSFMPIIIESVNLKNFINWMKLN
uniref:Cytochrome c oxidase subunit 2 n=1 Tax=Trichopria drosophilae TaxID=1507179 RepID=A0A6M3HVJ7_9HYME|nr:cytochrome c oxidase subunit II [Trichopria drosophilae]QIV21187.1 cytochrome c oxidase subunit II [Trichopria drosophilae]